MKNRWNLFGGGNKTKQLPPISVERKQAFDATFNDLGKFVYEVDGFVFQPQSVQQKIKWAEIERLICYKQDLLTTDEICMDIFYDSRQVTISEETAGWYQFVEKTKLIFPSIPQNWDREIVHPAFATHLTIIYQRADREMPEGNNFYASFSNISKAKLKQLLEQNNWTSRRPNSTDFELRNNWTELTLEGNEDEPLLNGSVAFHKDNIFLLNKLFKSVGANYVYEFYDEGKQLIHEEKSGR